MQSYIFLFIFIAGFAIGASLVWILLKQQLKSQNEQFKAYKTQFSQSNLDLRDQQVRLDERNANLEQEKKRQEDRKEQQKEQQEYLNTQFKNLANNILQQKTDQFKKDSGEQLTNLLKPFQKNIDALQKQVKDSFSEHHDEQTSLKKHLSLLKEDQNRLHEDAQQLTKALKGDSKTQGDWGEVQLAKILEDSGLRKDQDYTLQETFSDGGKLLRPDAVVYLPDNKHVIIDSKVSLTSYQLYSSTDDETEKEQHLTQFLKSIKNHITGLNVKDYQDINQLHTTDFVLMFIPIEGVFALAGQQTNNLFNEAWKKKIVLVSPSTLFACLKTVELSWKVQQQSENAEKIAKRGGLLYDKLCSFVESFRNIDNHLQKAQKAYDTSAQRLTSGKGNAINQANELKALGLQTKKQLPADLGRFTEMESTEIEE